MRHYETIYIINPNLSDDDYSGMMKKVNTMIEEKKGVIIKKQEWGKQKLAYDINKLDKGSYVLVEYCADAGLIADLERLLTLDDKVLKFQTVKLADKADPEALLKQQEESKEPEAEESKEESENIPVTPDSTTSNNSEGISDATT